MLINNNNNAQQPDQHEQKEEEQQQKDQSSESDQSDESDTTKNTNEEKIIEKVSISDAIRRNSGIYARNWNNNWYFYTFKNDI